MIQIHTQLIGQPQSITDERGTWRSTIFRQPVATALLLEKRGFVGDQVADTKHHGSLNQAVCCHPLSHYAAWNVEYALESDDHLTAGAVGENWTLTGVTEEGVCVNDIFEVGRATVQVSVPRYPCFKQERKVGLPNFLARTKETLRSGFYLRVLEEGEVTVGDRLLLVARSQPNLTIARLNRHLHHQFDPALADQLATVPELDGELAFLNRLRPK